MPCCFSQPSKRRLAPSDLTHIDQAKSLNELINSKLLKNVRLQMLESQEPEVCRFCYQEEKQGIESLRQRVNKFEDNQTLYDKSTYEDGSITPQPKLIDLRLGNTCNLECRMCSPNSSQKLLKIWNKLPDSNKEFLEGTKKYSGWTNRENTWNMLIESADSLEQIRLAGGEPTLIKSHNIFLKSLIERDLAKKISLNYNTNVTEIHPQLESYLKQFKQIDYDCSVDGHGKINEYIRFPSQWTSVEKNLIFLDEMASHYKNLNVRIFYAVSLLNILSLCETLKYLEMLKFKNISFIPVLNIVHEPSYLCVSFLPIELKNLAYSRWCDYRPQLEKNPLVLPCDIERIEQVFAFMNAPKNQNESEAKFREFIFKTRYFDQAQSSSLSSVIPEYAVTVNSLASTDTLCQTDWIGGVN